MQLIGVCGPLAPVGYAGVGEIYSSDNALPDSHRFLGCRQCGRVSLRCPVRAAGVFVRGRSGQRAGFRASAAVAPPFLQRPGLAADGWLWGIESFGRLFRAAIGRAAAPADFAASHGRRWLRGISAARLAFGRVRHLATHAGVARRLNRQPGRPPAPFTCNPPHQARATSPKSSRSWYRTAGLRFGEALGQTCNSGHGPVK